MCNTEVPTFSAPLPLPTLQNGTQTSAVKGAFRFAPAFLVAAFLAIPASARAQAGTGAPTPLSPQASPAPFSLAALPSPTPITPVPYSSSLDAAPDGPGPAPSDVAALPDSPTPQSATPGDRPPSSKRIFGIIPNFRTVSTDVKLPPQTVKQKFTTAAEDSFDYSSLFIPAALAAYSLGTNADPEFGSGGVAYGRYLWHSVVDQTSENFLVEAIVPSITHEDSRFYTLSHGGAGKRAGYALTRAFVTRSDSGKSVFNASEIFGSGLSAGISSLYYPSRERSVSNTGTQWGLDIGIDAVAFVVKEFAPDVTQKLFGTPKDTR